MTSDLSTLQKDFIIFDIVSHNLVEGKAKRHGFLELVHMMFHEHTIGFFVTSFEVESQFAAFSGSFHDFLV
jgi:hypothetical protein